MKKLLIFIGALTVIAAVAAILLPVEITEDGDLIIFGKKIGKGTKKNRSNRVICTDNLLCALAAKLRAKKDALQKRSADDNCEDCDGCMNCEDCTGCEDCTDCVGCEDCVDCMDCVDCLGCESCNDCVDCVDCVDCDECTGCVGLIGVSGAKDRSDFKYYEEEDDPE